MRVALDAMGGDHAPGPNIEGAAAALEANPDLEIRLVGDESLLRERPKAWTGIHDAVARAQARIGDALCPTCPLRQKEPETRESWYYMI